MVSLRANFLKEPNFNWAWDLGSSEFISTWIVGLKRLHLLVQVSLFYSSLSRVLVITHNVELLINQLNNTVSGWAHYFHLSLAIDVSLKHVYLTKLCMSCLVVLFCLICFRETTLQITLEVANFLFPNESPNKQGTVR